MDNRIKKFADSIEKIAGHEGFYCIGNWSVYDCITGTAEVEADVVVAWMPLPEPYRAE